MKVGKLTLAIIVFAQFCCTSLWFAGNGVISDLISTFELSANVLGNVTSAVQFGFIIGTLTFAILTIADRFSPSKVFLVCAILGATFNLGLVWQGNTLWTILGFRFLIGFFLAGIYPVGMKIAADYFEKGLGKSLGFLVGALVVGTAFPHLLKSFAQTFAWTSVLFGTSSLAVLGGGLMIVFVPDGPYRKPSQQLKLGAFYQVFQKHEFRSAAFGYFGHMWELYAFWAFVPVMLQTYNALHVMEQINVSLWSFILIALGGLACVIGGYFSQIVGTRRTAFYALLSSGLCCLASPFILSGNSEIGLISFLIFWGLVVIADSPLFSTLVAQNAPSEIKGTALTIVNCIGFAITIVSIQILSILQQYMNANYTYLILALGPLFGLASMRKNKVKVI